MATSTSGRTHEVSPDALPARTGRRRPGQMPYFRALADDDRDAIRANDPELQNVTVQRRITRAFTSDATISQRRDSAV